MMETFMTMSIFATVLCTFIVLGLTTMAGVYIFVDKIHEIRRAKRQERLNEELKRINRDLSWLQGGNKNDNESL